MSKHDTDVEYSYLSALVDQARQAYIDARKDADIARQEHAESKSRLRNHVMFLRDRALAARVNTPQASATAKAIKKTKAAHTTPIALRKYIVKELAFPEDDGFGTAIYASSLTEAKKIAYRTRRYIDRILVIEHQQGWRLATRRFGVWHNGHPL